MGGGGGGRGEGPHIKSIASRPFGPLCNDKRSILHNVQVYNGFKR